MYSGLGSHCFSKELGLPKMLLQWSGWVSMSPVHPRPLCTHVSCAPMPGGHPCLLLCTRASCPFQQRPVVWWLHEEWTHHAFSWLCSKTSTMVVTNALRVGVLSLLNCLRLLETVMVRARGWQKLQPSSECEQMKNCQGWLSAYPRGC